jgi:cysteinyl-tRNA synthetase
LFVLGVDGHTALVFDLDAGTASVTGIGGVTVRVHGQSAAFPAGVTLPIEELRETARRLAAGREPARGSGGAAAGVASAVHEALPVSHASPYLAEVERLEEAFERALAVRDVAEAVARTLEMERTIVDWSRDTAQSDDVDHARTVLRSAVVRLGDMAVIGSRDPREAVAPFVDALLEVRRAARETHDFATSDRVRDRLVEAGIEVRDTPDGAEWYLHPGEAGAAPGSDGG